MTNRPVDARQPAPAGVTERNQPVVQYPDITEPTGLWREQGVEAQPEESSIRICLYYVVARRRCEVAGDCRPLKQVARDRLRVKS